MKVLKKIISKFSRNKYKVDVERLPTNEDEHYSSGIKKIMNLLNYTKKSSVSYSAGNFNSGYHTFDIDGHEFKGQRNPKLRFENMPFSFNDLSVLDIGCNQGGMLYSLSDKIKYKLVELK